MNILTFISLTLLPTLASSLINVNKVSVAAAGGALSHNMFSSGVVDYVYPDVCRIILWFCVTTSVL